MHILRLKAENVKRLEAVTITPDGKMVVIGGPNGAGKSSALDCIEMALGGKRRLCAEPLRRGSEKGEIIVETDQLVVRRSFTAKDSYLEVTNREGFKAGSPQELLDALVGDLSFDPLEFTRMDPRKQAATMMRLLGLDFAELDAEYGRIEQERRDIGRDAKNLKALAEAVGDDPEAPTEEVVVADLVAELEKARERNQTNATLRATHSDRTADVERVSTEINTLKARVAELEAKLVDLKIARDVAGENARNAVDIDTAPIQEQLRNAESVNRRVREQAARRENKAAYDELHTRYDALTDCLRDIETEKQRQISAAAFPVPGVTFGPDGVLVNDLPFDQASSAEQLRIAVAMGFAANPKLRIVLIRDGSLLDETSLAAIAEMAEQYDAQVWMERVGEGEEVSVVIREGRVAEDRTRAEVAA